MTVFDIIGATSHFFGKTRTHAQGDVLLIQSNSVQILSLSRKATLNITLLFPDCYLFLGKGLAEQMGLHKFK